jgi:hypothetical protein
VWRRVEDKAWDSVRASAEHSLSPTRETELFNEKNTSTHICFFVSAIHHRDEKENPTFF